MWVFFIFIFVCTNMYGNFKVLFVTNKFPYEPRQYLNNQIEGFIDQGIEVTILAHEKSNYSFTQDDYYNLEQKTYYTVLPLNKREYDILYYQFGGIGRKYIEQVNPLYIGKKVVCFRGADATSELEEHPHKYDLLFKKADLILVVCQHFKNRLIAYGCPPEKIYVHHSGIDCNKFKFKERSSTTDKNIRIISVGRLTKMKGFCFALKAIAKLVKIIPNLRYEIIGNGELFDKLQTMITDLGLRKNVFLRGQLSHDEVITALNNAHIFLLTSCTTKEGEQEGIPNVLMEALASGLPVVATNHSGVPELIQDGISGFLVPEKNVNKLVQKLKYLIQHSDLWIKFAKAGAQRVYKYHNKEIQNKKVLNIFKKLVNNEEIVIDDNYLNID